MNARPSIPPDTIERQTTAADPKNSVWVSANAGSGKTHVLALRVTRLLLGGTPPSRILCLTYTRAAAANMANRVFSHLADWAMLDDETLTQKITELEGRRPSTKTLGKARQLFASALETPGGLKIQTIHAFCESVLHQFPLEANIAAHFALLDGNREAALFTEARRALITGALPEAADGALAEAFGHAMDCAGEVGLEALLGEAMTRRDGLRRFIDQMEEGGSLFEAFGLDGAKGLGGEDFWPDPYFHRQMAETFLARADAAGKAQARKFAEGLIEACEQPNLDARLRCLRSTFLTEKNGVWQAKQTKTIASKGVGEHFDGFAEEFERIADAIIRLSDRVALLRMLHGTRAALQLADRLLHRYERLKSGRGYLDFNDLITRTARLLSRPDAGPWVQYKLDQGIDHILLDEAQDTSPDQWTVVRHLADEFFAGSGAREGVNRTLFAVGDEKQSIYSFQGAEPQSFTDTRDIVSEKAGAADKRFARVELQWSFRSTLDVLGAVDAVFRTETARAGLTRYPEPIRHKPVRDSDAGYVELWPSLGPEDVEEPDDWTKSVDHAKAPAARLAETIAQTVEAWLRDGDQLEGRGRPLAAGDVMVLVRKRDRFVHALSRSLKERGIAVAGADRIALPAHIAVKDLLALGRYLLQPEDDLSLAALLRSPVFGLTEDALYALAASRGDGQSLGSALREGAKRDLALMAVAARLAAWSTEAAFKPVFEFYAGVLGRDGVRRRMIARLGHEAGEILDEFMSFCLDSEKAGQIGLQAFLAGLDEAAPDIKREMDQTRAEVRIMTVHAAKGLEAPVVFLVDGGSASFSNSHMPRLIPFDAPDGKARWDGKGYLWNFGKAVGNSFTRELGAGVRQRADDEYRRLLYVGMTRAEDRLIVCGYHGKRPQPDTWHALVSSALVGDPNTSERLCPHSGASLHRFRISPPGPAVEASTRSAEVPAAAEAKPTLPLEFFSELPSPPPLPRPLAPSGALASVEPEAADAAALLGRSPVLDPNPLARSHAIARGLAFHRLIETLPALEAGERLAAAERYLGRVGADWPPAERMRMLKAVKQVLESPALAALWIAGSRAEVAVSGTVEIHGTPRAVAGKIDRLSVSDTEVLIVDFKTNRPPPRTLDEVPEAHVAQLALYRALLEPLYPTRAVCATLVYTEGPSIFALPPERLDEALAKLGMSMDTA
ncbi:MAG: double-strand break repair helicase AddA [Mesorhizobium amorphae]|nr:MAG: double-strand break repair helicase AddA [Mesorhizobium amorphae]